MKAKLQPKKKISEKPLDVKLAKEILKEGLKRLIK